jgi:hypothetical protein
MELGVNRESYAAKIVLSIQRVSSTNPIYIFVFVPPATRSCSMRMQKRRKKKRVAGSPNSKPSGAIRWGFYI